MGVSKLLSVHFTTDSMPCWKSFFILELKKYVIIIIEITKFSIKQCFTRFVLLIVIVIIIRRLEKAADSGW
jgi:hypothetical protein